MIGRVVVVVVVSLVVGLKGSEVQRCDVNLCH